MQRLGECLDTTNIEILDLKDNDLGNKGILAFAEACINDKSVNRIHKLDMSDIKANAEGTAKFFGYLSKSNTIRTFLYDKNPINDAESHKALSSVIGTNITIKSLSLNKCELGNEGADAIGSSITKNTTLKSLSLKLNQIGNIGAKIIAGGVANHMTALTKLDLSSNKIGDSGGVALAKGLDKNKNITHFWMRSNRIKDLSGSAFKELISYKDTMMVFDISFNSMKQYYIDKIDEFLERNKSRLGITTLAKL